MKMLKTVNVVVSMVQIDKVMLQIACVIFLTLSLVSKRGDSAFPPFILSQKYPLPFPKISISFPRII